MDMRSKFKLSFALCLILTALSLVSGCSESNSDGGITGTGGPLESYLKYGIAATNQNHSSCNSCLEEPVFSGAPESDDAVQDSDSGDNSRSGYSETNTQESGVDELDWLKTDGDTVFSYNGGSTINIFELANEAGTQTPVNTISLNTERDYLRGLYLDSQNENKLLISVADQYSYAYTDYFWHWNEGQSSIDVYDVNTPKESAERLLNISIEGQYVSSRKIGTKLYIITQYSSYIDDYVPHPYIEEDVSRNTDLINQSKLEDLLPTVTLNGQSRVLLSENDCHIPNAPEEATQPTLAIVTVVDLDNAADLSVEDIEASCIAAPISTIYASNNAVYLVEDEYHYGNTDSFYSSYIYKIDFDDAGLNFGGSVSLKGNVGWDQQFRLSEYQDHLRVVTTDWSNIKDNVHRLHTVSISDTGLSLNATIPNEEAPADIGKPGESIYSVRFSGEKAYIVTFRRIDPFYVIDLSNHDAPFVAGELELHGYSNYLHPFGENLVFGLGRDSDNGIGVSNIKLALFDVSDMTTPELINELFVEGDSSYSPAEYSHTALSILPSQDNLSWRLGFAASISDSWEWMGEAYYLFEVKDHAHEQGASLSALGNIPGTNPSSGEQRNYYNSYYDRGVLTDSYVHYSHDGYLITEFWDQLSQPE